MFCVLIAIMFNFIFLCSVVYKICLVSFQSNDGKFSSLKGKKSYYLGEVQKIGRLFYICCLSSYQKGTANSEMCNCDKQV